VCVCERESVCVCVSVCVCESVCVCVSDGVCYKPPQHTATHRNTLQHSTCGSGGRSGKEASATHCNTLLHTATQCLREWRKERVVSRTGDEASATHCNTLYHTATHRNTVPVGVEEGAGSIEKW